MMMTIAVSQRFYGYVIDVTGKTIHDTTSLLHFLCSIVFSGPIQSRFPSGSCQGTIPVPKASLTVAKSALVFYLLAIGFNPLPLSY